MTSVEDILSESETSSKVTSSYTPPITTVSDNQNNKFSNADTEDSGHPSSLTHSPSSSSIVSQEKHTENESINSSSDQTTDKNHPSTSISKLFEKSQSFQIKELPTFRSVARNVLNNSSVKNYNCVENPSETSDLGGSNHSESYTLDRDSRIASDNDENPISHSPTCCLDCKETSLSSNSSENDKKSKELLQLPNVTKNGLVSGMPRFPFRSQQQNDAEAPNRWQNAVRTQRKNSK